MSLPIKFLVLDVDGTMTDGGVLIAEDGKQMKKFNAKDGVGIRKALKQGIEVGIISHSHISTIIQSRADMLGIRYCYVGEGSKLDILNQWLQELGIVLNEVAFMGDDINDMDVLQAVGHSVCPADATEEIKKIVKIVLNKNGGEGCVREYVDYHLLT